MKNGVNQGILFLFDEIHLTFDSQGWRNAPRQFARVYIFAEAYKCIRSFSFTE